MATRGVVLLLFAILFMCSWMMVYIIELSNNVNYLLKEVQELQLQLINDGHVRDAQVNTVRKEIEQEQARQEGHHQINLNVFRTKEILPTIQTPEKGQKSFANQTFKMPNIEGVNVVSMSLWGSDGRYTNGALANAELVKVFFPGWTLRIYTESRSSGAAFSPRYPVVPMETLDRLRSLGADIQYVDPRETNVPAMM